MSDDPNKTLGMWTFSEPPLSDYRPLFGAVGLGKELGRGGMAVVRTGQQHALERAVAIKSSISGGGGQLIAEARLTGALEHPNIVPVHDLLQGPDGSAHVVLKRVDGTDWESLLLDDEGLPGAPLDDPMAFHLDVLESVCQAVAFAHDEGVIHRDLKPDNIMVGRFGEVYVMDWGIAVQIDELGRDADRHRRISGTPRYMSPEQAAARPEDMGFHTDVYLLGGVLLRVLQGFAPHRGWSVATILASIPSFEVELEDADEELMAFLRKAMHCDPTQRMSSAAEFLVALRRWRGQRAARQWAQQAIARADECVAAITNQADRDLVYGRYGAASFGLESARRQGVELSSHWRRLHETLAQFELDQGNWMAAEMAMAPLANPDAELLSRLQRLKKEEEQRSTYLLRLERDADGAYGSKARRRLLWVVAGFWTLAPLVNAVLPTRELLSTVLVSVIVGGSWWQRRRLWATQRNRTVIALLAAAMLGNTNILLAQGLGVFDAVGVFRATSALNATMLVGSGLLVDRRFFVGALAVQVCLLTAPWTEPFQAVASTLTAAVVSGCAIAVFGRADSVDANSSPPS